MQGRGKFPASQENTASILKAQQSAGQKRSERNMAPQRRF
jgi:hypothetical protein